MKKLYLFLLVFVLLIASACKSVKTEGQGIDEFEAGEPEQTASQSYKLEKIPNVMLWKIRGFTGDGQPSTVYLLGTYHAGDGRMDFFPQSISQALQEADRFCCEISSDEWAQLPQMMESLTMQGFLKDLSHTLIDDLSSDEINLISQYVDPQTFASLVCFDPWVLNNYLQSIVMLASGLDPQKAYDIMIMNDILSKNPGTKIEGLDQVQVQLDLTAWGDWDTQLLILRDTLADLNNLSEAAKEMTDLYEIFLSGDEVKFEEAYFKDIDQELLAQPVYQEYLKALLNDRNQAWSYKIADWLDTPGTTFVFAGCAHFVGPESVFYYLKQLVDLE